MFSSLTHAELDVWEALDLLGTLREYEMALLGDDDCDTSMPLNDHALQTAEACRWGVAVWGRGSQYKGAAAGWRLCLGRVGAGCLQGATCWAPAANVRLPGATGSGVLQ